VQRIIDESTHRNDMIRAQIKREKVRTTLTRDEFLADLKIRVTVQQVGASDPRFARGLELLNKTNQFNTTGKRWTEDEARSYLSNGGVWWAFEVQDRFTRYGLVGLLAERDGVIEQFVMSCRVFGLDVELAVLRHISNLRGQALSGLVVETERNGPGEQYSRKLAGSGMEVVGLQRRQPAAFPISICRAYDPVNFCHAAWARMRKSKIGVALGGGLGKRYCVHGDVIGAWRWFAHHFLRFR
jgi:hypothetical protein